MGSSLIVRLAVAVVLALSLLVSAHAREDDYEEDDNGSRGGRSTWELNTSLLFNRYFEPFARVASPSSCRDRCVYNPRCSGWTYYDANFKEAGRYSYKLQRVCVLGAGIREKKAGNRPGRTSGVVGRARRDDDDRASRDDNGRSRDDD